MVIQTLFSRALRSLLPACGFILFMSAFAQQGYSFRPLHLIVPFAAGWSK